MESIEQAIFTSTETDHSAGYRVVAASDGVGRDDLTELAVWGPSHDSLLDRSQEAASLNFHPLPSGAYCISRTTATGWEYSGRGARVYTQCLVVPPEVLRRFANNAFAVMRAASAIGAIRTYDEIPARLEPFHLAGGTAVVDSNLLARLATNPGSDWMASLVQAALDSLTVAVTETPIAEQIIAGLINCLPPECRPEFSFSTGLRFCSRRLFRIVAIADDKEEQRRLEQLYNVTGFTLSGDPPDGSAVTNTWAQFIRRVLGSGHVSLLATQLTDREDEVALDELSVLGMQFLENLDAQPSTSEACVSPRGHCKPLDTKPSDTNPKDNVDTRDQPPNVQPDNVQPDNPLPSDVPADSRTRAHRAHQHSVKSSQNAANTPCRPTGPATLLEPDDPKVLALLEKLDDLIYNTVAKLTESLAEESFHKVNVTLHDLENTLSNRMPDAWREQYLRYALSIWTTCNETEGSRPPERAVRLLDILCSLLDEPASPPHE